MTVKKDETQLRKGAMVKVARKAVRGHYEILADRELNEVLPAIEAAFDADVKRGILPGDAEIEAYVRDARRAARKALDA